MKKALKDLKASTKNNIKGYVIDMRNNPGGVLGAAVDVSDAFIKEGELKTQCMNLSRIIQTSRMVSQ